MAHEETETVYDEKTHSWVNKRTINKNKPMNPEQKRFFAKIFKTEKEASTATRNRSERYRVRERQRLLGKNKK